MSSAPLPAENRLLAALPRGPRQRILSNCEHVALDLADVLSEPGERIRHVYFPTVGFISLVVRLDNGAQLEVGIIGSEGMLGASLTLGVGVSPQHAVVQGAGRALRMSSATFELHCRQSAELRQRLGRYIHVSMRQLAQTAACTHYHLVEARLARWLLMSRDGAGGDQFHLTHEFLSFMLGVRRVGVTHAARALQAQGLIRYNRGDISILDNAGLERRSCECYERGNEMYEQTMGSPRAARSGHRIRSSNRRSRSSARSP